MGPQGDGSYPAEGAGVGTCEAGGWGLEGGDLEIPMAIKSYRDLDVWWQAMKLAEVCYKETDGFPSRETYGMANQIRRAAVSIASNIAEGNSREFKNGSNSA